MDQYGHNHHHTTHHRREDQPLYPPPPNPYAHPPPPHVSNFPSGPPDHYPSPPPPYTAHDFTHTHHHRRDEPLYPPPPNPYVHAAAPPPPNPYGHSAPPHASNFGGGPPDLYYPPPPPVSTIHHDIPHVPSVINHHHIDHKTEHENYTKNKPTVRVYSKAKPDFSLTIRDGKVILAPSKPSDPFQHWIKDEKFSIKVKDEEGFPSFALVNKATGEAMKHSVGATYPVQLTKYNPDKLDESVLWTQSKDLGDGYRAVRMVNNIRLNVDAFNGDKNHGGVHDGTKIVLWEWKKGDNQRWTMVPY